MGGCTLSDDYQVTYTNANANNPGPGSPITTWGVTSTFGYQIYELGNALGVMTGQFTWDQAFSADMTQGSKGYLLQLCVFGTGIYDH
jgi:hypothetical protein